MAKPKSNFITDLQAIINDPNTARSASLVARNVETAAVASKLINPREPAIFRPTDPNTSTAGPTMGIDQISKSIAARIEDSENIFQLFPDIELGCQITIGSILSPKDMIKSELIYRNENTGLPPEMTAKMLAVVKKELETQYNLIDDAPVILRDALFRSGSHVRVILPESAVDELINQRTSLTSESIYSPDLFMAGDRTKQENVVSLGILGNPHEKIEKSSRRMAFESIVRQTNSATYDARPWIDGLPTDDPDINVTAFYKLIGENLEISDNYRLLKLPSLLESVNQHALDELTTSSVRKNARKFVTEAFDNRRMSDKPTAKELGSLLYKSGNTQYTPFMNVPGSISLKRRSVGRPLILTIPSEAAIPVHVPGKPDCHIGYFVPIDVDGNPVSASSARPNDMQGLSAALQNDRAGSSASSLLIEKAKQNIAGASAVPTIDRMTELYADLIENDTLTRLSRGLYGRKLSISRNNEIYRIMLSRALQSQFTRLIYIPAEYTTYFAFNYHRNGVGKSYLDDLTSITSLRAMVIYSKVMASVKSSISTTHVNVTLDPNDHDPTRTIELAKHYVARSRQQYFPHGLNRVADLTDWIHRAGIQITFEGHPRLPTTKFDFESKNIEHAQPDDSLEELFRHQTYMHMGLSPEMMDTAVKSDFATTIEKNSIMFSRRIMMLSNKFSKDCTDYGQKIASNDQVILSGLTAILNEHKADLETRASDEEKEMMVNDPVGFGSYIVQSFIDTLEIDLPKPDSTSLTNLSTEFKEQEESIDAALNYILSDQVLASEFGGDTASYVSAIRAVWKAHLMREWMANNNFAPEAFEITDRSEDGRPMTNLLETTSAYTKNVMANIVTFIDELKAAKAAADKDIANSGAEPGSGGSSDSSMGGSDEFGGGNDNDPFATPEITPDSGTGDETTSTGEEGTSPETPNEDDTSTPLDEGKKETPDETT